MWSCVSRTATIGNSGPVRSSPAWLFAAFDPLALCGMLRQAGIMTNETFILIPGRTSDQGCGISEGKYAQRYSQAISTVQMNADDMNRLGLEEGCAVRIRSEFGSVVLPVVAVKGDELPCGLLFMAYGEYSSRLMGGETHGSGMPTSKGMDVTIESADPSEIDTGRIS